jgi:PKD repeat protein
MSPFQREKPEQLSDGKNWMTRTAVPVCILLITLLIISPTLAGNTVTVGGDVPLIAAFSASPPTGYAPLTVQFTDRSTGAPTSWRWTFGDGSTSYLKNPGHVYERPGTYTVTLTVAIMGRTASKEGTITVLKAGQPPIAAFTMNRAIGRAPLEVRFLDRSRRDPAAWSWRFGDGGTSVQQNPVHTYLKPGFYMVTLRVSNPWGDDTARGLVLALPLW